MVAGDKTFFPGGPRIAAVTVDTVTTDADAGTTTLMKRTDETHARADIAQDCGGEANPPQDKPDGRHYCKEKESLGSGGGSQAGP